MLVVGLEGLLRDEFGVEDEIEALGVDVFPDLKGQDAVDDAVQCFEPLLDEPGVVLAGVAFCDLFQFPHDDVLDHDVLDSFVRRAAGLLMPLS